MVNNGPSSRSASRRALGRDTDALLPAASSTGLREVDVARIEPNPSQPRQHSTVPPWRSWLRPSRRTDRTAPRGERERRRSIPADRRGTRWQAAKLAGVKRVPVIIKDASDRQTLELALIENIQRSDLNALEEATAYQRLIEDYGLTQQQVAEQVGKSRTAVTNTLRLLTLPQTLKRAVMQGRISEGRAGAPPAPRPTCAACRAGTDRARGLERSTNRGTGAAPGRAGTPHPDGNQEPGPGGGERTLQNALGARVSVRQAKKGGRIIIEYGSSDEFEGLYRRLAGLE